MVSGNLPTLMRGCSWTLCETNFRVSAAKKGESGGEGEEGMNSVNQRCCCECDRRLRRGKVEREGKRQEGKEPECLRRARAHTHTHTHTHTHALEALFELA